VKVLVIGARGQLGGALLAAPRPAGMALVGVGRPGFDLTRAGDAVAALEAHAPDVVVNAAAWTDVDGAESQPDGAMAANRDGPARLARACADRGAALIHLSTDYVFDGRKTGPWREDDPVGPLNVYGASKAAGEDAVRAAGPRHVIVRTSWLYAPGGRNFVETMLRLGRERAEVAVVADQTGTPTAAGDLALAILRIAGRVASQKTSPDSSQDATPWGTFHVAGRGAATWFDFAGAIFDHLERATGRRPRLVPTTAAAWGAPAPRPANSCLDCARAEAVFGIVAPPWQDALARVLTARLAPVAECAL
jgi:dTDP-4-dehydrorhamnose reductase